MAKRQYFKADKVSGAEATVFMLSPVLEIIRNSSLLHKFYFPFYALSWNKNIYKADEWIDERGYEKAALAILRSGQKDGYARFLKIEKKLKNETTAFRLYSQSIIQQIKACNNEELIRQYNKFMDKYEQLFGLGAITFLYESILSTRLSQSLIRRHKNATEIIGQLIRTPYKSFMITAEEELLKIKNTAMTKERNRLIGDFLKKYYYVRANYTYSPLLEARYINQDSKEAHKTPKRRAVMVSIKLTREEKAIVKLLKITEVIRDQRKIVSLIGPYIMSRFTDEAAKRWKISHKDIDKMFWFEYEELLFKPKELIKKLRQRKSAAIVFDGVNGFYFDYNAVEPREKIAKAQGEIVGTPASSGMAWGRVCVVLGPRMFSKLKKGNILVTEMTRPDFVPIMRKAAAFITDEGGLTSHTAIVAREMRKPCVVGVKNATQIFKDGDMVEVDAEKGIIKRLTK